MLSNWLILPLPDESERIPPRSEPPAPPSMFLNMLEESDDRSARGTIMAEDRKYEGIKNLFTTPVTAATDREKNKMAR
jgi:hypothetical protein